MYAVAASVAMQIIKWASSVGTSGEEQAAAKLAFNQVAWERALEAVPPIISERDTSPLFLRLTGTLTGNQPFRQSSTLVRADSRLSHMCLELKIADDHQARNTDEYPRMALFVTELLCRLSDVNVVFIGDTEPRAWLISALLQSYSLAGLSLFTLDPESEEPVPAVSRMPVDIDSEEDGYVFRFASLLPTLSPTVCHQFQCRAQRVGTALTTSLARDGSDCFIHYGACFVVGIIIQRARCGFSRGLSG